MSLEPELIKELNDQGADFVYFVDISHLSDEQNKQYPAAILMGVVLSPGYIKKITSNPDYVQDMIHNNQISEDEFDQKEMATDRMADYIASYITAKGYSAYSQSEDNLSSTGFYDEKTKSSPLPHKTIAGLGGLGWIGKHNLLVTPEFGSAISMCTVLTDAPIRTVLHTPGKSLCGECRVCVDICSPKAIKGKEWDISTSRDELVDVYQCTTCLKCLVLCPWTQDYVQRESIDNKKR